MMISLNATLTRNSKLFFSRGNLSLQRSFKIQLNQLFILDMKLS